MWWAELDRLIPKERHSGRPDMLGRVRAVADEMMAIEIDWSSSTLSEGWREAQRILADRHPELTHEALEALSWMLTYNGR